MNRRIPRLNKEATMTHPDIFRLVTLGAASQLTLGEVEGEHEEADKTRYDIPA